MLLEPADKKSENRVNVNGVLTHTDLVNQIVFATLSLDFDATLSWRRPTSITPRDLVLRTWCTTFWFSDATFALLYKTWIRV